MSQKTDIAPAVFKYMPEERDVLKVKVNLPQEKIDIINRSVNRSIMIPAS